MSYCDCFPASFNMLQREKLLYNIQNSGNVPFEIENHYEIVSLHICRKGWKVEYKNDHCNISIIHICNILSLSQKV